MGKIGKLALNGKEWRGKAGSCLFVAVRRAVANREIWPQILASNFVNEKWGWCAEPIIRRGIKTTGCGEAECNN
jgi:hypothetical protein